MRTVQSQTEAQSVRIDFWYDDCPRAEAARQALAQGLSRLTVHWVLAEHRNEGACSPSVTVNGADVLPGPTPWGRGCRLDVPTADQIVRAVHNRKENVNASRN